MMPHEVDWSEVRAAGFHDVRSSQRASSYYKAAPAFTMGSAPPSRRTPAAKESNKSDTKKSDAKSATPPPPSTGLAALSRTRKGPSFTMGSSRSSKQAPRDTRPSHDASIYTPTLRSSHAITISTTPRFKEPKKDVPGPGAHSPSSKQTAKGAPAYSMGPTPERRAREAASATRQELKRALGAATVSVEAIDVSDTGEPNTHATRAQEAVALKQIVERREREMERNVTVLTQAAKDKAAERSARAAEEIAARMAAKDKSEEFVRWFIKPRGMDGAPSASAP